jgi:hypothetical protein
MLKTNVDWKNEREEKTMYACFQGWSGEKAAVWAGEGTLSVWQIPRRARLTRPLTRVHSRYRCAVEPWNVSQSQDQQA